MPRSNGQIIQLNQLSEDGKVPSSRLTDPEAVREIVNILIKANEGRSETDAAVFGCISGNAPWNQRELRANGMAWRANFASRIGEASFNLALSQFNDVILESPNMAVCLTEYGRDEQEREDFSGIITEEFQRLNDEDDTLVYNLFLSQHEMVLYRCGPVMFEDDYDYRFRAIPQRYVLVPDESRSNAPNWKLSVIRCFYTSDELYGFVRNPDLATAAGWNVAAVRNALMKIVPYSVWPRNRRYDWEWYEQRLNNNDLYWGATLESIPVAHVLYREFPRPGMTEGKVSRCAVLEDYEQKEFLFRRVDAYDKWQRVIHPFYYDRGDGTHHSVKGYGIKGYGAWSTYDRFQCHLIDAGFLSSSMHFQANTPNDLQNLSVTMMGPYMWHPPGGTYLPTQQIAAGLEGPMAVKQDLLSMVTNNLAQYRQQLSSIKRDRVTAREVNAYAENEALVGKSQMSRYFEQLDDLWTERFRRASNPDLTLVNSGGAAALEFQQRCAERGVPRKALQKMLSVKAYRTVGLGSPDMRRQAFDRLYARLPLYDETGRMRVVEDITALDVGYRNMRRYLPKQKVGRDEFDQRADATDKVAGMKVGVAPIISPSQNAFIYAETWLKAADEVAGTLEKTNGQTMPAVLDFLEIAGPSISVQLQRMQNDETRKRELEEMTAHWKQLASLQDKLRKEFRRQTKARIARQQQLQDQQQKVNGELQIRAQESQGKVRISEWKAQRQMRLREEVHRQKITEAKQDMVLRDAKTASEIQTKRLKSLAEQPHHK